MLSKYFKIKTNTEEFKDNLNILFEELKDKKVLLYGAGDGFVSLDKKYDFKNKFNIVGIADLKFEKDNKGLFNGFKKVSPNDISKEEFDVILITGEQSKKIVKYVKQELRLACDIKALFTEKIKDEQINLNYLYKHKFDKTLPKLVKDMQGKKVVLYGAGAFLELMKKYFDLSGLDVIGVCDKRFDKHEEGETFLDWKAYSVDEVAELKPDYILISTKMYIDLVRSLRNGVLKDIKLRPLLKKSLYTLMKEIWC